MIAENTDASPPALRRRRRRRRSGRAPARRVAGVARRPARRAARSPCSARSRGSRTTGSPCRRACSARRRREVDLTLGDGSLWREPGVTFRPGTRVVGDRPGDADGRARHRRGARLRRPGARDRFVARRCRRSPAPPRAGSTAPSTTSMRSSPRSPSSPARTAGRRTSPSSAAGSSGSRRPARAKALGAIATIVHSGRWLMSAQLDEGAGQALGRIIPAQGIALRLGDRALARSSPRRAARVLGLGFADGSDVHGRHRRLLDRHHAARRAGPGCRPRARRARRRRDRRRLLDVGRARLGHRRGRERRRRLRRPGRAGERDGRGRRRPPRWAATPRSPASTTRPSSSSPASMSRASATRSPAPRARSRSSTPTRPAASTRSSS